MIQSREDLLNGLAYVHEHLCDIQSTEATCRRLKNALKAPMEYQGLQEHGKRMETESRLFQSQAVLVAIPATIAAFLMLISLITGDLASVLMYVIPLCLVLGGKKKPKLRKAAILFLAVSCVLFFSSCGPREILIFLAILAVVLVVEVLIIRYYNSVYLIRKNKGVDAYNQVIRDKTDVQNQQIAKDNSEYEYLLKCAQGSLRKYRAELHQAADSWYPPNYYTVEAAAFFYNEVLNFKADTIQQLVRDYDAYKAHQEEQQRREAYERESLRNQEINNAYAADTNRAANQSLNFEMLNLIQNQINGEQAHKDSEKMRGDFNQFAREHKRGPNSGADLLREAWQKEQR